MSWSEQKSGGQVLPRGKLLEDETEFVFLLNDPQWAHHMRAVVHLLDGLGCHQLLYLGIYECFVGVA